MPPSGTNTPCVSVWVTTVWIASAWSRRETRVQRLRTEDPLQTLVIEVRGHPLAHPTEPAPTDERCDRPPRPQQIERRIEVDVDEVGHLDPVEALQPVGEAAERLRVRGPAERPDLLGHRLATASDVQGRTVAEHGAVHRVDRVEAHEVGEVGTGRGERGAEHLGHRQRRRTGVELESRLGEHAGTPTRNRIALQHGDLMTAVAQVSGGGQAPESGAHDDDSHVRPPHAHRQYARPPTSDPSPAHEVGERDQFGRRVAFELDLVERRDGLAR